MYVADVASAVVAALKDDGSSMGKLYELGGPDVYTMRELVILSSLLFPCFIGTTSFFSNPCKLSFVFFNLEFRFIFILQAELMYGMIREWPHYVNVPFPIAKVFDLHLSH